MNDLLNKEITNSILIEEKDITKISQDFDSMAEKQKQDYIDQCKDREASLVENYEYVNNRLEEEEAIEYLRMQRNESIRNFKEKYPNGVTIEEANFLL